MGVLCLSFTTSSGALQIQARPGGSGETAEEQQGAEAIDQPSVKRLRTATESVEEAQTAAEAAAAFEATFDQDAAEDAQEEDADYEDEDVAGMEDVQEPEASPAEDAAQGADAGGAVESNAEDVMQRDEAAAAGGDVEELAGGDTEDEGDAQPAEQPAVEVGLAEEQKGGSDEALTALPAPVAAEGALEEEAAPATGADQPAVQDPEQADEQDKPEAETADGGKSGAPLGIAQAGDDGGEGGPGQPAKKAKIQWKPPAADAAQPAKPSAAFARIAAPGVTAGRGQAGVVSLRTPVADSSSPLRGRGARRATPGRRPGMRGGRTALARGGRKPPSQDGQPPPGA